METGIQKEINNGNGNVILYTALLAAIVANCTPTPADYFYFRAQQRDKEKLENGEITPKQYWRRDIAGYYGYTAGYYAIIFLTLQAIGGTYKNNARVLMALLSGGLIIGVYAKNVQKDEELQALHAQNKQQQATTA
jgi:hypothetical protein